MRIKSVAECQIEAAQKRIRDLMLTFAALKQGGFLISPSGFDLLTSEMLAIQIDLDRLQTSVRSREAELSEVVIAATAAIAEAESDAARRTRTIQQALSHSVDALQGALNSLAGGMTAEPDPALPANVIVFTGSYRPHPANDAGARS